ncbi:Conidial yellow pigment biosynthesis polyketide synthase [Penicillium chrysogenum]|uniref:Conidial yellow pigment biosynthesis polyketide synthase n=1 Tax=Penicillium chrysogenum TaxID=5076 RepID=A0A167U4I4_PENCH|nr:Conidial yellow pigment biosynthesis polyketide synthase [Penicillium chrysogenum]
MTFTTIPPQAPTTTTILLFGDQTDSWIEGIDQLYNQAASTPWLKSFVDNLACVVNAETKTILLDRALQNSLGHFTSLQELGDRYRHSNDEFGVARALLLHTLRVGTLLQWAKQEPSLLGPNARSEWLGISGGLISLSALAVAEDFDTLVDACLEVTRVLMRLCKLTSVRSRSMEDHPGIWGWAVLGISADDLRTALDQFQQSVGIPPIKRAKVGVSGVGWNTVIGPPSVIQLCIRKCPAVKTLAKNPLEIKALQHTLNTSPVDIDYIVGDNLSVLNRPISCPNHGIWGLDDPLATFDNWGGLLRTVCSQVLSRPLDVTVAAKKLNDHLFGANNVRIVQLGSSSHAPYLANVFKAEGRNVSVEDQKFLLHAQAEDLLASGRIAFVGMAERGPGSDNPEQFWDLIVSKQDLCTEVPKDRFDVDEYYCSEHGKDQKRCVMTTRYGCFMKSPGVFDSRFFKISPREAMLMDPGHRQFLMCTYEALEMAGYSDGQTQTTNPHRIAAFLGQCTDDWHDASHPTLGCDAYTLQGVQRAFGPGRLAWHFKWEGPTYSFDSACASSTASIHLACMSLLSKDIDMAVAGANNILSYPHSFTCLSKSGVLSDTGNCKPFRDDADGYCRGDFVGAVVLKRLEDAVAHNDNILAVVVGSGRNHSGNSTSITTSDSGAQERLFRKVMRNAQVSPDDISYVEMHGTGTQVGDPAEVSAVANTFKKRKPVDGPLMVGGVKGNFGHSEAAAGLAELIKCIMMFKKNIIPPQAGMPHALNPRFPPLSDYNIEIPAEPKQFKKTGKPRRILLNNFDAAGGNACMVLEDYTPGGNKQWAADPRENHVIASSARTQASYLANKRKLIDWLRANPTARIEDVAYTTTARRMHHQFRFACTAATTEELITKLEASEVLDSSPSPSQSCPIVFLFTGQGSHYSGMGSILYHTSPVFRDTVHLCVSISEEHGFPQFLHLITEGSIDMSVQSTVQTQLAVLTLEIGLAAFWGSVGVQPSMVIGHSLGEYAALHISGVLSLADVLYLVGCRALLLLERCELDTCSMLSVSIPERDVQDFLGSRPGYSSCDVACINSPVATVISGGTEDISHLQADLTAQSKHSKTLTVPYGFHSIQMDPILPDYISIAAGITYSAPRIPVASTLLGSIVDGPGTFGARYLAQQMRQRVDFVGALNSIKARLDDPTWLELGPSAICGSFVRATLYQSAPTKRIVSTLEGPGRDHAWVSITKCLATAYTQGVTIDWLNFHEPYKSSLRMVTLPSYAWDLKDYWVTYTDVNSGEQAPSVHSSAPVQQKIISTCAQYVVRKSSSSNGIDVTIGASLVDPGLTALIDGHRMVNEPICPGSVFCEAAIAAATYALETNGRNEDVGKLAIRNPVMSRPLTKHLVGPDGELLTTVSIKHSSRNEIQVIWKAAPLHRGTNYDLGSCTLTVCNSMEDLQAGWDRMSYFIKTRMYDVVQAAKDGRGHRFRPDIFYALFGAKVQYDAHYKAIKEAYVSEDFSESAAELVLKKDPVGTQFVASPYWGETSANLAGFTVNANPQNQQDGSGTSFINSGFDSFEQTAAFQPEQTYFTYVRVSQVDNDTRSCEIFIFDSSYKLMAQCSGLKFRRISNTVLGQILSGKPRSSAPQKNNTSKVVQKEHAPVAPVHPADVSVLEEKDAAPVRPGPFQVLLESIARETGIDITELTDDIAPAEIGVDSIMAIEVTATVSSATGVDLLPSFVVEHPTLGDLRHVLGAMDPSATSSPELTPASGTVSSFNPSIVSSAETSDFEDQSVVVKEPAVSSVVVEPTPTSKVQPQAPVIDESSPLPNVRMMLLKDGASKTGQPPFFLIADGTGSIGSYIHLPPHIKSGIRIYGVDSPYLRCPTRLTVDVGIPGAAKLIVEALLKKQPTGLPFWIGGFSGGAMISYEVCRQLSAAGHTVDGLLLVDMCSPRTKNVHAKSDLGLAMFEAISRQDESGVWSMSDKTIRHLQALFASVAAYNPPPLGKGEQPPVKRTAVIWAQKGMIGRAAGDPKLLKVLGDQNIPTEAYPGFMEDPRLGAVGWSLAHKTDSDLGPNGWDKYVGKDRLICASIYGDHLDLPTPGFVHLLGQEIEKAFEHFRGGSLQ